MTSTAIMSFHPTSSSSHLRNASYINRQQRSASTAYTNSTTSDVTSPVTGMSDIELQTSPLQHRLSLSNNSNGYNDSVHTSLQLPAVQSDDISLQEDISPVDYTHMNNSYNNKRYSININGHHKNTLSQQMNGNSSNHYEYSSDHNNTATTSSGNTIGHTLSNIIHNTIHGSDSTVNGTGTGSHHSHSHSHHTQHRIRLDPGLPEQFESKETFNLKFQRFTTHIITLSIGALLCLVDASLVITKAVDSSMASSNSIYAAQYAIFAFFVLDIFLRMAALRLMFFRNKWMVIDAVVTFLCIFFSLNVISAPLTVNSIVATALQSTRIAIRLWFVYKIGGSSARAIVSANKQRYTLHGFDLDLTYITDRIIAMGLPSTHIEAVYRNPINQVARFFNTIHANHYLIINLCSERAYPVDSFQHRVVRVPFDDHNPPPLATLLHFCTMIHEFLEQSNDNVVAVHCKGGKGRTGTMIAAWLLYSNPEMYAEQALKYFAMQRTSTDIAGKVQGVGGPSQKRYIQYFEELRFVSLNKGISLMKNAFDLLASPVELTSLTLHHILPVKNIGDKSNVKKIAHNVVDAVLGDEHHQLKKQQWCNTQSWSLLITHYPPRQYVNTTDKEDIRGIDVESTNSFYMRRYEDYEEFVFRAKPRTQNDDQYNGYGTPMAEDSITFDLTSFYTQSLCLAGDMKFQIFRGNLQLELDQPVDASNPLFNGMGGGQLSSYSSNVTLSSDEEKPYCFCWFWLNTSFLPTSSTQLILRKDQIDDACKNPRVDEEFAAHITYFSPPRAAALQSTQNAKQMQGQKYTMKTVTTEENDEVDADEFTGEDDAAIGTNTPPHRINVNDIRRTGHHVIVDHNDDDNELESPL
jgi:protein-tyrosine phosphatase